MLALGALGLSTGLSLRGPTPAEGVRRGCRDTDLASSTGFIQPFDELARILENHGPESPKGRLDPAAIDDLLLRGSTPIHAVVVVGDLRLSTLVLKEAVKPSLFARFIVGFTEAVRGLARSSDGWFDKFTGDGFIAFWLVPTEGEFELPRVAEFCQMVLPASQTLIANLRRNSRNFPVGVGLALGIDSGPCELVRVGGSLTIVGPAIVGATRMVDSAVAERALVNVQLGTRLEEEREQLARAGVAMARTVAKTKEYPEGQEAYELVFSKDPRPHADESRRD